jgi:putative ABC transport system permease protein
MMVKLTLRGLAAHKMRLALTALAIVLGVSFVSGTLIFSSTLDHAIVTAISDLGRGTDTVVRAKRAVAAPARQDEAVRPVPASLLATVRQVDGVADVRGAVNGFAAVIDARGTVVGTAPQTGVDWTDDRELSRLKLASGTAPTNDAEIAIDTGTAEKSGYRIGDSVRVALAGGQRSFTLTGTFTYGSSRTSKLSMVAFDPATAQQVLMTRPGTYTEIDLQAAAGTSQRQLRDAVARALPPGYEAITGQQAIDEQVSPVKDLLRGLRTFLLVFAMIALFVGSFIIFNTFTMLTAQRTRELALLRAVGATRPQILGTQLGEAAVVGLLASAVGLLAGSGLALGLAGLFSLLVGTSLPFDGLAVPVSAVLAALLAGPLVTLAAAYPPARRAGRIPPVAALREGAALPTGRSLRGRVIAGGLLTVVGATAVLVALGGSGSGSLGIAGLGALLTCLGIALLSPIISGPAVRTLGWPIARLSRTVGRLSTRNAQRDPRRTATTASALMIGLALVATVSVVSESMMASANRQLDASVTADYQVSAKSPIIPISQQVVDALAATPGVRDVLPIWSARLRVGGKAFTATAGEPERLAERYRLKLQEGTAAAGTGQLLVDADTARSNGWTVDAAVPGEYQDGTRADFRIAGIFANVKSVVPTAPTMIMNIADYRAHYPDSSIQQIEIRADSASAATTRALESALAPWPNLVLQDREAVKDTAGSNINLVLQSVIVLLILSIVIAALGIVNTLALSVIERTREVGLLRAVGMQRRQLRRMIRYEAVLISAFGAVLGIAVGACFGIAIRKTMVDQGVDMLSIPWPLFALYFVSAVVIGLLAAVLPARRAARMDILRAIAAE